MAVEDKFFRISDELIELVTKLTAVNKSETTIFVVELERDELKRSWIAVIEEYNSIMDSPDLQKKDEVKSKYQECYQGYITATALLNELAKEFTAPPEKAPPASTPIQNKSENESEFRPYITQLPPIDTDLFHGDYHAWPSFRDLFTAIYIDNPQIKPVQKLYYLIQKCRGEASDIIKSAPLSEAGFAQAWKSLKDRFENKRVLVNKQLKTLFNLSAVTSESGSGIKNLQREINNCIAALNAYEIDTHNWDAIFIYLCSTKLPEITLSLWEQSLSDSTSIPKWESLDKFLSKRFQTLETVSSVRNSPPIRPPAQMNPPRPPQQHYTRPNRYGTFHVNVQGMSCYLCSAKTHILRTCPRFLSLSSADKLSRVKQLKLCTNCLAAGHEAQTCRSLYRCAKCQSRHHTLLHRDDVEVEVPPAIQASNDDQPTSSGNVRGTNIGNVSANFSSSTKNVLLGTAQVLIKHDGVCYKARALIDPGSEASFISQRLQRTLKIASEPVTAQVSGLNSTVAGKVGKMCRISLCSALRSFECKVSCLVLPQLTGNLPSHPLPQGQNYKIEGLELADERWMESAQIDILIGGDIYPEILLSGFRKNILGSLLAQETVFGWILTGPLQNTSGQQRRNVVSFFSEVALDQQLTRFWEMEEVPKKKFLTEEEAYCEKLYEDTTVRKSDGRYEVRLPFRPEVDKSLLNGSKEIARNVFVRNEARLLKNVELKTEYDRVLQEYVDLGHMVEVNEIASENYFLPHHAVMKPDSTTTKVRVVFNASSRSRTGVSLNDMLYPGPILQADLMKLLLKWRFYKHVFNGDIEKMYRQILVSAEDTRFQRIFFRRDRLENLKEYELKTVTFGVSCAPYLAIRTLFRLAEDVKTEFPLAANILKNHMYVDDALVGAHDVDTAIQKRNELRQALESAGLVMRKWTANTPELLADLPKSDLLAEDFLKFEDTSCAKTLGIRWNAQKDEFYFQTKTIEDKPSFTKRQILSSIAKLFDPAGWLAPIIVKAKIMMQKIWLLKTEWDEEVPPCILLEWKEFLEDQKSINDIRIPRWIQFSPHVKVQYHAFSDASEKAYGACVYLRVEVDGQILSNILCAKSRVAPVKTLTLPRLELCGATLLAEMVESLDTIEIDRSQLHCWTDSTIVLAWLRKPPCTWKVFVAHRVAKINSTLGGCSWVHVESADNPADLVSRGIAAPALVSNNLWWHGPSWLCSPEIYWPKESDQLAIETEAEMRTVQVHFSSCPPEEDILSRFSSLERGIRVIAYINRFVQGLRKQQRPKNLNITFAEYRETRLRLIVLSQRIHFAKDYEALEAKKPLSSKSSLLTLNPFLDEKSVLRVGGRLAYAPSLTYDERHPILLPYSCALSDLTVRSVHQQTSHGGNDLMLRTLRSQYWIIKAKNLVRKVVRNCKTCILQKKETQQQIMSHLPSDRVSISRPFAVTGVDFCGPFDIKSYAGRGCRMTKGYVCLFICFATKAVHLEATSDLSTATFLDAFSRFIARRGCPKKIYSDNGTNFVGASREIRKEFRRYVVNVQEATLEKHCNQQLEWKFIPPGSPHMGGLWEAGVKSFKKHFKSVVGNSKFTFEEFSTLISRIEACLNSRPLSSQSADPNDLVPLTPGHFLIGGPLNALCESEEALNESLINRYRKQKALYQEVCRRWKAEYLTELQKRYKWKRPAQNVQVGDLVAVKTESLAPTEWRLGRVTQLHPGKDGFVRVATIRTAGGTTTRSITKLVLLPLN